MRQVIAGSPGSTMQQTLVSHSTGLNSMTKFTVHPLLRNVRCQQLPGSTQNPQEAQISTAGGTKYRLCLCSVRSSPRICLIRYPKQRSLEGSYKVSVGISRVGANCRCGNNNSVPYRWSQKERMKNSQWKPGKEARWIPKEDNSQESDGGS